MFPAMINPAMPRASQVSFLSLLMVLTSSFCVAQETPSPRPPQPTAEVTADTDGLVLLVATPPSGHAPLEVQFDADVAGEGAGRQEVDGIVVIEAEHYSSNSARQDVAGPWAIQTLVTGYSGEGYAVVASALADNGNWATACELAYDISFANPGKYHVWVRRYAPDGASNSVHVALGDGAPGDGAQSDESPGVLDNEGSSQSWTWASGHTIDVREPGPQVLTLRRREAGYCIDRILLTRDPDQTPWGGGPPESRLARRIEYLWHFGDGETSAEASPKHRYSEPGTYSVELVATELGVSRRGFLDVHVDEPIPLNHPPAVSAGIGSAIRGRRIQLNGFVEDDGLPADGGELRTLWTLIQGPGEVKWLDPELVRTTATFSDPGSYVLALNADDGEFLVGYVLTVVVE